MVAPKPVHCFSNYGTTLSDLFGSLPGAIACTARTSPRWLLVGPRGVDAQSFGGAVVLREDHDIYANGGMCPEIEPKLEPQPSACEHAESSA